MIYIQKNNEPPGLLRYKSERKNAGESPSWDEFSTFKDWQTEFGELRECLLKEQRFICCYCQQQISFKKEDTGVPLMKTEHFEPKGGAYAVPAKQLDYGNLLAVCLGNSDDNNKEKHCDSCKLQNRLIAITNPATGRRRDFKPFFKYDVRVKSQEVVVLPLVNTKDMLNDIEKVLNLNEQSLRSKRFSQWQSVWRLINKNGKLDLRRMEQILEVYTALDQSRYRPFCDFITCWLKEHIREQKH